ncbi:MAG TPA: ATP-binding protein [bacterium]|nr:ATP-binding protein [bacterium]
MPLPDLHALIAQGEGEHLEFKKTLTHPHKIARTLAAFANTRGGTVLVGVLDNGRITGVRDPYEERYALQQAQALTDPPVPLHIEDLELSEEQTVVRATVAESPRKPHRVRVSETEWRIYVRAGAESVQSSDLMARILRHDPIPTERPHRRTLTRHEAAVLDFLATHPRITAPQVTRLLNLSLRRTRQLLLALTLDGFLLQHDREREPFWTRLASKGD